MSEIPLDADLAGAMWPALFFSLARLAGVEVSAGDLHVLSQPLGDLNQLLSHLLDDLLAMMATTSSTIAFMTFITNLFIAFPLSSQ